MKILKFYAPWCAPCSSLTRFLELCKNENLLPYDIEEINIDEDVDRAASMGVRSVPTLVLVNEAGKEMKRHVGIMMEDSVLRQFLTVDED